MKHHFAFDKSTIRLGRFPLLCDNFEKVWDPHPIRFFSDLTGIMVVFKGKNIIPFYGRGYFPRIFSDGYCFPFYTEAGQIFSDPSDGYVTAGPIFFSAVEILQGDAGMTRVVFFPGKSCEPGFRGMIFWSNSGD